MSKGVAARTYRKVPYRYVEWHLYNYHENKHAVALKREEIIHSGTSLSEATLMTKVQNSNQDDSTQRKAIELVDNRWLQRMEYELKAVESGLLHADDDCRRLVRLRYWGRQYTDYGVAREMHLSMATYYRVKNRLILSIAREMGMEVTPDLSGSR